MKASQQKVLESIKQQMNFIMPIELLEVYLKEMFHALSSNTPNTNQRSINQLTFQEYLNYPLYISAKIFNGLAGSKPNGINYLSEFDFVFQMMSLFIGDFDMKVNLLSKVFDFQSKGIIFKADIILLFELFDYQHRESIRTMIDNSFGDNESFTLGKFQEKMNEEGDVVVLFIMFLIANTPFKKEEVEYFRTYFSSSELNINKQYSLYNCSNNILRNIERNKMKRIGISQILINFLNEHFNVDISNAVDITSNELVSTIEGIDDDLNELNVFETDLSSVISNSSMSINIPIKMPMINLLNVGLTSNDTIPEESQNYKSESTIIMHNYPTTLINLTNERKALSSQNSPIQLQFQSNVMKPTLINPYKPNSNSNQYCFVFLNKSHQLINCKLTYINCSLYIEKQWKKVYSSEKSQPTYSLKNPNNLSNNNNSKHNNNNNCNSDNNCTVSSISLSHNNNPINNNNYITNTNNNSNESTNNSDAHVSYFKYSRLLSLKSTFAVFLGEEVIDIDVYYKMKLVIRLNNQSKEITLYSKDMLKLKEFINGINFNAEVRNIKDDYLFDEEIGKGSFSKVYLGLNKKTKVKVAIKEMQMTMKTKEYSLMKNEWDISKILSKTPHESLVLPIDCYKSSTAHYFIFEYLEGITLRKYLDYNHNKLSLETKLDILIQIAEGIAFLHSLGITHRDIKPDNIIVLKSSINNTSKPLIKLIDYGFAKILGKNEMISNESYGTLVYIAPEILNKKEYNFQVDVWSFGVVMYQMLFNELPFGEHSDDLKEISYQITRNYYTFPLYTQISIKYIAIIKQCLVPQGINRPNIQQLLIMLRQEHHV